jgi:RimJ/RimL family protein N-acetyltransferase
MPKERPTVVTLKPLPRPFQTQEALLYYPQLERPDQWPSAPEEWRRQWTIPEHSIRFIGPSDLAKREAGMKGVTKFVQTSS